jgi:hypothetical protein
LCKDVKDTNYYILGFKEVNQENGSWMQL